MTKTSELAYLFRSLKTPAAARMSRSPWNFDDGPDVNYLIRGSREVSYGKPGLRGFRVTDPPRASAREKGSSSGYLCLKARALPGGWLSPRVSTTRQTADPRCSLREHLLAVALDEGRPLLLRAASPRPASSGATDSSSSPAAAASRRRTSRPCSGCTSSAPPPGRPCIAADIRREQNSSCDLADHSRDHCEPVVEVEPLARGDGRDS